MIRTEKYKMQDADNFFPRVPFPYSEFYCQAQVQVLSLKYKSKIQVQSLKSRGKILGLKS